MASRTAEMNTLDETEYSATAVTQPPKIPSTSANTVNKGKLTNNAYKRGATSFRIIGSERAHSVDLLRDDHRYQLGGNRGADASGHHQSAQHWSQLAHKGNGDEIARL